MTRWLFSVDPRVRPGSALSQTYCCLSDSHTRGPREGTVGKKLCNTYRFLPEGLSCADIPNSERLSQLVEQVYQALMTRHTIFGEPLSDEAVVI